MNVLERFPQTLSFLTTQISPGGVYRPKPSLLALAISASPTIVHLCICTDKRVLQMRIIGSALVLLLGFGGPVACYADELLKIGSTLNDFTEFFASGTVNLRDGRNDIQMRRFRYELRQGEKIEGGCKYSSGGNSEWGQGETVIAQEVAHDLTECKRLFLVGIPYPDSIPDWMRKSDDASSTESLEVSPGQDDSSDEPLTTSSEIADCETGYLQITDGNQAAVSVARALTGWTGIPISTTEVWAKVSGTPGSMVNGCGTFQYGSLTGDADYDEGGIGWDHSVTDISCPYESTYDRNRYCSCTREEDTGACLVHCKAASGPGPWYGRAGISATLTNKGSVPLVFDCSAGDGAKIVISEVSIESQIAGDSWALKREFSMTGPVESCLENVYVDSAEHTSRCD
nr:hypothetical protein [Marinobacter lipolyticus]